MKIIPAQALQRGDLVLCDLTGSTMQYLKNSPPTGRGWLLIEDMHTATEVRFAIFSPKDQFAITQPVMWPTFDTYAVIRGGHTCHTPTTPFAVLHSIFGSRTVAVALA